MGVRDSPVERYFMLHNNADIVAVNRLNPH